MFVVGPYSPYSCHPLECAAPRRAPILHVGDAMAERARAARNGASKAAASRAGSKTVAAGGRTATRAATVSARKATAAKPAGRKAAPASQTAPVAQDAPRQERTDRQKAEHPLDRPAEKGRATAATKDA